MNKEDFNKPSCKHENLGVVVYLSNPPIMRCADCGQFIKIQNQ